VTTSSSAPPAGTIGYIDVPDAEAILGPQATISGWALDPAGIRAVEVRLDGVRFTARTKIARRDVAELKPGYPDGERGGFEFTGDFTAHPAPPGVDRRTLEVVAIATDGRETRLGKRSLIEPAAFSRWPSVAPAGGPAFHILPALSGAVAPGVFGLERWYSPYLSPTTRIGMRVPILYLRTTRGAREDFVFDPGFDLTRKCGERSIADDNLAGLLAVSIEKKLPVLITLNGGVWADASCSAPEWDLNDWLEQDAANCQWNEKNEVMPDDFLRHLPGSLDAPELARSLTFNVYATDVRRYKKRNLQQAARHIVEFMREHPDLFVGVNVDPDTYLNPFFEEKQWYDYNPGTLEQFRHWLAGTGPYAGAGPDAPDLRRYRRRMPLELADVRRISGKRFSAWQEVDPPRVFSRDPSHPFWTDPWVREWEIFRRHLVSLHYDDLSRWLVEAGIPRDRIWSSQGFMAPAPDAMPFAISIDSPVKNFDSGGMSVEGSMPAEGHLGAILYGASAVNRIPMENGRSLFTTFAAIDPGFAVVELNTADLRHPSWLPSYAEGYHALRDLWNAGARFVSPMAWNGWSGDYAGQPGYAAHTSWRNTPLEDAACDFMIARAGLPLGSLLWTFGSARHAEDDGWSAAAGAISPGKGQLVLEPDASGLVALLSPEGLPTRARDAQAFVLGLSPASVLRQAAVFARSAPHGEWRRIARGSDEAWNCTAAGIVLTVDPSALRADAHQWRVELIFQSTKRCTLTRIAALLVR
jgi:hypothetical protein